MHRRRAQVAGLLAATGLFIVKAAVAAPLELTWDAPPECPSRQAAEDAVARLIRSAPAETVHAGVHITRTSAGFTAELRTAAGVRTLDADTCRELAEALVVIVALMVDPHASDQVPRDVFPDLPPASDDTAAEPSSASPSPAPAPRTSPPSPPLASPPPYLMTMRRPETAPRQPTPRVGAALHGVAELGTLPQATAGALAKIRLRASTGALELGAGVLLPQSGELDEAQGGDFWWWGAHAAWCVKPDLFFGCAGIEAGRLSARGYGVDRPASEHTWWVAPRAELGVAAPLDGELSLELTLGVAVPLLRPRFGFEEDSGGFHRASALSGRLGAGIGWR